MLRSLDGLSVRQLVSRKLRSALTAMAVMLGVAMVFAVLLLSTSVRQTFGDLIDSAWGTTDQLVSGRGGAGLLSDKDVRTIQDTPGVASVAPMAGGVFRRLDPDGTAVEGMKGNLNVAGYDPSRAAPYDLRRVAGRPVRSGRELMVERNWAADRGVEVGDVLRVATPGGRAALRVVGIFRFSSNLSFGGQGLAVMPITAARPLFGLPSGWHQVSVRAEDRAEAEALGDRLRRALGPGHDVKSPTEVGEDVSEQLRALDVLLLLFGGMALFVGGFLIFNAFSMTVAQRMRELGTLRTLGAGRRAVTRTVLVEAAVLAAAGTVAGLALGVLLAQGLLALMRGLGMPVGTVLFGWPAVAGAVVAGFGATLLGAAWPARRAGRVSPIRAVLGETTAQRRLSRRRLAAGLALFLPGAIFAGRIWFGEPASALVSVLGLVLTMAMFAGTVVLAPWIVTPLIALLARPLRRLAPASGRLASDALRGNPLRTAATAAALTVGLSVVVVNATMATSFVHSVDDQLAAGMVRDLTVRPLGASLADGGAQTVPPGLLRELRAMDGVRAAVPVRATFARLPGQDRAAPPGVVIGVEPAQWPLVDRAPVAGASRAQALAGLRRGEVVLGAGYAKQEKLETGDVLELDGPGGVARLRVAAVLAGLDELPVPSVQVSDAVLRQLYGPVPIAEVAVRATSRAEAGVVNDRIDRLVERRYPDVEALSSAEHRKTVRDAIDQQFAFFNAIVAVAIVVSLLGIVNTLSMSVLERTRELGVLRALGASRWAVRRTVLAESVLVTVAGALTGLGLGFVIAWWWSRDMGDNLPGFVLHVPVAAASVVAIASVVLGVAAAALPARRAARLDVLRAIHAD